MNKQEYQSEVIQAKQEALNWQGKYIVQCEINAKQTEKIMRQTARIAELEAENERLKACESALISMVNQFFYSNDDDNTLRHAFMSAEEEAANYLVEHGIAQWVDERKGAIYFKEVQK